MTEFFIFIDNDDGEGTVILPAVGADGVKAEDELDDFLDDLLTQGVNIIATYDRESLVDYRDKINKALQILPE